MMMNLSLVLHVMLLFVLFLLKICAVGTCYKHMLKIYSLRGLDGVNQIKIKWLYNWSRRENQHLGYYSLYRNP